MKEQMIQVGAFVRNGQFKVPSIREFEKRRTWAEQHRECDCVAFYNSGQNLFVDPERNSSVAYYYYPWKWVPYREFCEPKEIVVNDKGIAGFVPNTLLVKHRGHHRDSHDVTLELGRKWKPSIKAYGFQYRVRIPSRCILYVAVRMCAVKDYLLISQSLPIELLPTV